MKILYLNNQFHLHGGIEKILSQKINYLIAEFQYDVILCTSEHKNKPNVYPLNDKVNHIDLEINYDRSKSYFHPKNVIKAFKHYKKLKQEIKRLQPDIIVSVNFTPEQYFLPFIEKQIPKVKEFHSSGVTLGTPNSIFSKLKYNLFKIFGKYDALVVLNPDEKKYYPFTNIKVIPNFIKLPLQVKFLNKEKTIIAAGRIVPVKQFDHLIRAWSKIAIDFPDWQVKIFGDGDEVLEKELNSLITELQVPNIRLMGQTQNLKDEMEKASVYAMTSATECFPMVLLEAQAAQMALISYDCPNGPRNIVNDGISGVLTPHNAIDKFTQNLKLLLKDKIKIDNIGKQAKLEVERFSENVVMKEWHELFKTLVK